MEGLEDSPLGYLLYRVAAALRSEVVATALEPLELTFSQYLCLRLLSQLPGKSNAQLAREATVSPQAMNKVIRELQERGLVTRPATVSAGRSLPATLTREGTALLAQLDPLVLAAESHVLAKLSAGERREFRRLLAAVG
ncbi:MarR family winged helix-turn-helix transcriptional regulator [Nocardia macrotermitis]|nr:MarR family transcriptional regulator [Nocardia macrotermitis]